MAKLTMRILAQEASQAMRHIKNEIKHERMSLPTKTTCINILASRPKIGEGRKRTLWDKDTERGQYVDEWYSRIRSTLEGLGDKAATVVDEEFQYDETLSKEALWETIKKLKAKIHEQSLIIIEHKKKEKKQAADLQRERLRHLPLYSRIDEDLIGKNEVHLEELDSEVLPF